MAKHFRKRNRILAQLLYVYRLPKRGEDVDASIAKKSDAIRALLCQAEDLGEEDFLFILREIKMSQEAAHELITIERALTLLSKDLDPLIEQYHSLCDAITQESYRLKAAKAQEYSDKWKDLVTRIIRVAKEVDRKTAPYRAKGDYDIPSFVDELQRNMEESAKLEYPDNEQAVRKALQFFEQLRYS